MKARSKNFFPTCDRFLKDDTYRDMALDQKETCVQMNQMSQEDRSYVALRREREMVKHIGIFSQRSAVSQRIASRDRENNQQIVCQLQKVKEAAVCGGTNCPRCIPFSE